MPDLFSNSKRLPLVFSNLLLACRRSTQLGLVDLKNAGSSPCHSRHLSELCCSVGRTTARVCLGRSQRKAGTVTIHTSWGEGRLGDQVCDSDEGSHLFPERSFDLSFHFGARTTFFCYFLVSTLLNRGSRTYLSPSLSCFSEMRPIFLISSHEVAHDFLGQNHLTRKVHGNSQGDI